MLWPLLRVSLLPDIRENHCLCVIQADRKAAVEFLLV